IVISTLLNKAEKNIPFFSFTVNLVGQLMAYPFFQPVINAFIGGYQCFGIVEGNPHTAVTIDCNKSYRLILTIICTVMMAMYLIVCGIIRLFIFAHNLKKGGLWTTQIGIFQFAQFVLVTIYMLVSLLLRAYPLVTAILGLVFFILLLLIPMFIRNFYHARGNAVQACTMAVVVVCYIMGVVFEICGSYKPIWLIVILWIVFGILQLTIPFLIYQLTYKMCVNEWAMHEGEIVPEISRNKNVYEMNTTPSPQFGSVSAGYGQPGTVIPNTGGQVTVTGTPIQNPSFFQQPPFPQSQTSSSSSQLNLSNQFFTPNPSQIPQLKSNTSKFPKKTKNDEKKVKKQFELQNQDPKDTGTKLIKRLTSISRYQHAIRFITVKALRKRKECMYLSEDLLYTGLKRIGQDSSLWMTIALFHMSYTKNKNKALEALRNCKTNIPNMIERFLIYCLLRDLESSSSKSGSGGQANQQGVAFRSKLARAQRTYELSRAYLTQGYLFLSKENLDMDRIMNFLDKAIDNEYEAHNLFDELMKMNSSNVVVLRAYGALLRDIYRDDDTALMMFNEANAIEEDLAAGGGNYDEQQSQVSKISSLSKGNKKKSGRNGGQSQKSGLDGQSIGNKKKKKRKKKNNMLSQQGAKSKENLIPGFMQIIMVCMFVNIIALTVNFILVQITFSDGAISVDVINKLTDMMVQSNELLVYSRFYFVYVRTNSSLHEDIDGVTCMPSREEMLDVLLSGSKNLKELIIFAYGHTKNNNEFAKWEAENIQQVHVKEQIDPSFDPTLG
ncbi:MAG: hypothetical protein EZS28_030224, partial [Streblomastix strix]